MGLLRWSVALGVLAGCAEISGLSGLEVGDGGAIDASSEGASGDAAPDAHADVLPIDAPMSDVTALAFCQKMDPGSYAFCSDFDEGDVLFGWTAGLPALWTSGGTPKLDTSTSTSSPASALFEASPIEGLSHTIPSSQLQTVSIEAQIDVVTVTPSDAAIFFVAPDNAHVLNLLLKAGTVSGTFIVTVHESNTLPDGGTEISNHLLGPNVQPPTDAWILLKLSVTATSVGYAVGTSTGSFVRSYPSGFASPVAGLGLPGNGWSARADDVIIRAN